VSALYRDYRARLLAFFLRNGASREQGEDLLQEVFIRVVRNASTFRGEARVSTWFWSIARNCLLDDLRRARPEVHLDDDGWSGIEAAAETPGTPERSVDDCVQRGFSAFARRFPERAEALRRVALDGWSIEEVAQFLQRTNGAAREYLSQCRKKLKAFLEPCRELLKEMA
jgi:RNA polymerase sigma factor (sigma-70 family)